MSSLYYTTEYMANKWLLTQFICSINIIIKAQILGSKILLNLKFFKHFLETWNVIRQQLWSYLIMQLLKAFDGKTDSSEIKPQIQNKLML